MSYTVASTTGTAPRTGTLNVGGRTFTVTQRPDTDGDGIPDVVEPGEGGNIYGIAGRDQASTSRGPSINFTPLFTPQPPGGGPIPRPEGNFGTGGGSFSLSLKRAK